MNFILARVMGGIALVLVALSYFTKEKKKFFIIQIIANIFYGASFIFNMALVGGINFLICTIRIIVFFLYERKKRAVPIYVVAFFCCAFIVVGGIFFKDYYDLITIAAPILFTIAMCMKDMQMVRYLMILPNVAVTIYSIINQVYTSALLDFLEVLVIVVSIIVYHIDKKRQIRYLL